MTNVFQGDPALILGPDGATLEFTGGQPKMDTGLENQVVISLFTAPDWPGNHMLSAENQIGSDFEEEGRKAITLRNLTRLESVAVEAVQASVFGDVTAGVTNPESYRRDVKIGIEPPGGTAEEILLTTNGQNWINQGEL